MTPVSVAFLWHMHQPLYRLRGEASCFMPWVRLHALRSYYDMVRVLEEFPEVRVTVNLVPVLLEQIRAYEEGGTDLFWETGAVPAEDLDETQRVFLFDHFFSAQAERMIGELPRYADLLERRTRARRSRGPAEAWKEFSDADYRDLQALFDLAWFGFKSREDFPELRALRRRGRAYTQENIRELHAVEREILRRLRPLYREAAAGGQIEITTSPYAHPILPLLIDSDVAREAMPRVTLPPRLRAPEDARAQVEEALAAIEADLGVRPRGLWPSEGSVSQEAAALLAACGLAWAASDEEVLLKSDREGPADPYRPWRIDGPGDGLTLVFRDHELSDKIGFSYARAEPAAAAESFLAEVQRRARCEDGAGAMILIALDGENPWESYRRAGAEFLRALYGRLSRATAVVCRPVGEALEHCRRRGTIKRLHAGSWIRADFGTWIGGPEKNRAWSLLTRARSDLAAALADPGTPEKARRDAWTSIRAAEGSDWFWWLDGQFTSVYRSQFDQAFRGHLRQAHEALGRPVPDLLGWPVPSPERRLGPDESPAVPAAWIAPTIDGYEDDFFEWQGTVCLSWSSLSAPATMQRASRPVAALRFGFSRVQEFCLRLDPDPKAGRPAFAGTTLDLSFRVAERTRQLSVELDDRGDLRRADLLAAAAQEEEPRPRPSKARAAARKILELTVPFEEVGLAPGLHAGLLVRLRTPEEGLELREIDLRVPSFDPKDRSWSAL